ncbi:hypothetical protein DYB32_010111 [Aphanomyces invadans]|uniref:Uncharacterized protein n=1 Tax=Aphanomyces invadans TaxID=157072 RepID=A0A3R7A1Z4_9STRA|nr:hypothetical protein DYB32_010111 [Aphanomyces invadans]
MQDNKFVIQLPKSKAKHSWQPSYARKYALDITSQDGLVVKSARCKFCFYFGRCVATEAGGIKRKRGPRTINQFFGEQFRSDVITKPQPGEKWAEYSAQSSVRQVSFIDMATPRANTMHNYIDVDSDEINLVISDSIVKVIIGEMMFRPEDELAVLDADGDDGEELTGIDARNRKIAKLRRSALSLFTENEDGVGYTVRIPAVTLFNLAIKHVSVSLSFRQVARVIEDTKNTCMLGKLGGINDTLVGRYVHVIVGHSLQALDTIIAYDDVWALVLSFDGSTHRGTCFKDICVRVGVMGVLYNLHLIAMPHFDRRTAQNQETKIDKLLNALFVGWIRKLIGVTTDREKTNMGHRNGVQVRMVRYAQYRVIHLYVDKIDCGAWVKKTYEVTVYLRRQSNLITEMGVTSPKKTNRWIALGSVLKFDIAHEPRITTFFAERAAEGNMAQPPVLTSTWWILVHALSPAIELITETFVKLQQRDLVLCQQRKLFVVLADEIADLFKVCRIADCEGDFDDLPVNTYVQRNQSIVPIESLRNYVKDFGSRARVHWEKLDNIEQSQVFRTIGLFAIGITDGIRQVEAERDPMNKPSIELAPLIMPHYLVKMRPATSISEVLEPRKPQLEATSWIADQINTAETGHRDLTKAYNKEPATKAIIDKHDHLKSFNDAWDEVAGRGVEYLQLRRVCAGLATIFPNSTSAESDFSILKWEMDEFRTSMLDLSLEGIFQAKQFELLDSIMVSLEQ